MPILHPQPNATGNNPKGQTVQIPPGIVLQRQGPYVQVAIGIARSIAEQLIQKGLTLPSPLTGIALIDTDL